MVKNLKVLNTHLEMNLAVQISLNLILYGKVHPYTGTEVLYRLYGP